MKTNYTPASMTGTMTSNEIKEALRTYANTVAEEPWEVDTITLRVERIGERGGKSAESAVTADITFRDKTIPRAQRGGRDDM